jgi:hypothetical protein
MLPLKYPATMIEIPNRKHATSERTSGTVGFGLEFATNNTTIYNTSVLVKCTLLK